MRKDYIFLSLGIILFITLYTPFIINKPAIFLTPDENINYFFSLNYAKSGKIAYEIDNTNLSKILHPRGALVFGNKMVPTLPVGTYLIYSIFYIINENAIYFASLFILLIGYVFYFLLIKEIFGTRVAIISSLFVPVFAPIWHFGTRDMIQDIPMLSFLIMAIYYFLKWNKDLNSSNMYLSSIFFGVAILIHYKALIFIVALCLAIFVANINNKNLINIKLITKSVFLMIILLSVLFAINYEMYGSPTKIGYDATSQDNEEEGRPLPIFYINFEHIALNLKNNLVFLDPLFFMLFLLSLLFIHKRLFKSSTSNSLKIYIIFVDFAVFFSIFYLGTIGVAGLYETTLSASFVRYFLPSFVFVIPFIFTLLINYKTKMNKNILVLLILCLLVGTINVAFNSNSGFKDIDTFKYYSKKFQDKILNGTETDSVILTQYYDKMLFPYREIADISLLPGNYQGDFWVVDPETVVNVSLFLQKDRPTYILIKDGTFVKLNIQKTNESFQKQNYYLRPLPQIDKFYKVERKK